MNAEQKETARLREKYPWIVKWGRLLGSFAYYIDNQVHKAEADGAPTTAIYKREDEGWATIDDITSPESRRSMGLPPKDT